MRALFLLNQALNMGPPEIKAEFIHSVRTRTVRPVGIMGDRPGGLVFEAAIVKDYLKNLQAQTQHVRSFHEVPPTLGIHPNTIASLIQRGHLSYRHVPLGFFVEEQSLLAFDRRYIACSTLAKIKGMPHSQIMMMLQELNLKPLQMHGKGRAGQRTFIDRRLLPLFGIGNEGLREAA